MTTFNYTTGNPANLTGGSSASMNDIQGPLLDVQTFFNGANIDTSNLATSAKPVTLLGEYRTVASAVGHAFNESSGVKFFGGVATTDAFGLTSSGVVMDAAQLVYLDPADYAVSGLTAKLRVRAMVVVNNVAPAQNFVVGLYPYTAAGGAGQITITAGTVVSGSTATINTPAANATVAAVSTDFNVPSAGGFALGVSLNTTTAANSNVIVIATLQVHHV